MGLAPNQTLLHYRLVEKIGEGGMGVVWKAVDTDLDREIAIKVLPEAFAADGDRLARFQREAKLLASLNHPNIATVHGLHEAEGVRFLAMELVEGQDLARHLSSGAIPLEKAVDVARQIAEALEAAHENGIVHRDLKPANVLVSPDGQVKVLDFGLAKPASGDSGDVDPGMSPTLTSAGTQAGMILGTAAYLSPEQAKGNVVDRRTDIWAFGVVVHEMLTGARTFHGEGISETLAAVILKEPDLEALPADTPLRVRELVRRCLVKDARKRLRDIGEARVTLEEAQADPRADLPAAAGTAEPPTPAPSPRRLWPLALVGVVLAALAFLAGFLLRPGAPEPEPIRLHVELSAEEPLSTSAGPQVVPSPDGTKIAFAMGEPPRLHVRSLGHLEDTVLSGTEGAATPFFSPDGQWIAFFTGQNLKKVSINGGAPLTLAESGTHRGGSWGPDDSIVYAPHTTSGLLRISGAGGEPEELTVRDNEVRERSHRWPHFLPGGRKLFFVSQNRGSNFNEASIELLDLETREHKVVHRGGSSPRYVPGGFLVFAREATLFATRFDAERGETLGSPVPVLEDVSFSSGNGGARFAYSENGTMIYASGTVSDVWTGTVSRVDADGTISPLQIESGKRRDASLSPDGRFLAYSVQDPTETVSNIWIYDLERDVSTRLTFAEAWEWFPFWTPDGRSVTYSSERSGDMQIYRKPADGSGEAESLTPGIDGAWAGGSWSPDGKHLVFTRFDDNQDLLVLDVEEGGEPTTFLKTDANETFPSVSPDGRWVAYESNESGVDEIYVRPFPGPGGKWQISQGGGDLPLWSPDGKSLYFYKDEDGVAVEVPISVEGDSLRAGRPREVLNLGKEGLGSWTVTPDGTFFLTLMESDETPSVVNSLVTFVFHWPTELEDRVP